MALIGMKIKCDVCEKGEAAVYCIADEAALCNSCDHRVHHANKLASKHQRFSLIYPPAKQAPICDICQDRRAFLFCQQDRAILCRECDIPIHKANEHTGKHSRFLLTGVKLSASLALYSSSSSSTSSPSSSSSKLGTAAISTISDTVPSFSPQTRRNKLSVSVTDNHSTDTKSDSKAASSAFVNTATADSTGLVSSDVQMMNGIGDNNSNTSSIAEYLIETLPGWHVDDLFDSSSSSPFGFCKGMSDSDVMPFWDGGIETSLSFFSPESTSLWVPQAAATPVNPNPTQNQWFSATSNNISFGGEINSKENQTFKPSFRKHWNDDNIFAVPQISPPASNTASKRLRTLW